MFVPQHIDLILGPERNPRQGFSAQDILRWSEGFSRLRAGRRKESGSGRHPEKVRATGMDDFFARIRAGT